MFEKIKKTSIDKITDDIKQRTEDFADSITNKISDVSDAVQNKTDEVSKTVSGLFASEEINPSVDVEVDDNYADEPYSVDIESVIEEDYDRQQELVEPANPQQESANASYEVLENRRKSRKKKSIAAIIASVVVAGSAIGGITEYSENVTTNKSYEQGVSYIMEEEYDLAVEALTDLTLDDAASLYSYAYVQSNIEEYIGKPASMLEDVQEVDGIENTDVKRQYTIACEDLELATKIQDSIDSLNLSAVNTISKGEISVIRTNTSKLSDRYKILLTTDKYDLAERVLDNVESNNEAGQLIADLDNLGEINLDSKDDIERLETAYNNLSNADKETILNYSILTSAENTYSKLRKEEDKRIAAEKKAEEERLAAEKKAEEDRKAAEAKAEEERLAAAALEAESNEQMVWIPRTGSKFHSSSSCSNMKNPEKVTRSEAERRGFDPCKKCHP